MTHIGEPVSKSMSSVTWGDLMIASTDDCAMFTGYICCDESLGPSRLSPVDNLFV